MSSIQHGYTEEGEVIHVDVDPFIPTGICAICTGVAYETEPPEDRNETPSQ